MAIKKTGVGPAASPATVPKTDIAPVDRASKAPDARFAARLDAPHAASGAAPPTAPAVAEAVSSVAREVAAGKLSDTQAQVDAVIARVVEIEASGRLDRNTLRDRVASAQLALGDHPIFAAKVQAMLQAELGGER